MAGLPRWVEHIGPKGGTPTFLAPEERNHGRAAPGAGAVGIVMVWFEKDFE
jgi:hypothetical protein